ncbi:MAG: asparagine synthase (glutamine-hydrolyzing) [Spirochaetota bacterium]
MCGIAGWFSPHKQDRDEHNLQAMAKSLYHRGPDGNGFFTDAEEGIYMAHTRLSIIDLQTGQQPIQDKRSKNILTANGEFYDYKRIRGQLVTEGFHFQTKSDSEIALKLYDKLGLDFMQHLRGEFAFALFDTEQKELLLVRDRFGIRPLFYKVQGDSVYYASEVKALAAHGNVAIELDRKALLHQMVQVMVPGTTPFAGVHAVKPGHFLRIRKTPGGLDIKQEMYWDADFPLDKEHICSEDVAIQGVRDKLIEAIGLRLEADVPVACYLSGGIDSCSILGLASAIQQSPIKAFTISFSDDKFDESHIAKEMAEKTAASQDILKLSGNELYGENYEKAIWHSERTFYNTLGVAKMLMSKHVTENSYKVVITGEGSDEIFGGYAAFKKDMFLYDESYRDSEHAASVLKKNQIFSGSILAEENISHPAFEELMGFTPSWIQPWMMTLQQVKPLLSKEYLEELGDYDPFTEIAASFDTEKLKGRHPLDKVQYTWMKTMLEGQILNWGGDRVDMANSLESRPAFLDHHLVEFAMQLAPLLRVKNGVEKWVLREAMKHILPTVLYKREKFAFMAPPAYRDPIKQKNLYLLLDKYVSPDAVKKLGMLDGERYQDFYKGFGKEEVMAENTRSDVIMNHLLGLHALQERFTS